MGPRRSTRIIIDDDRTRERMPTGRGRTPALNRTHCHGTRTHATRSASPTSGRVTRRGPTPPITTGAGIGAVISITAVRGSESCWLGAGTLTTRALTAAGHRARSAPPARAAVARPRAAASVARRHRFDARLHAIDLPEQNDRGPAVGRGRAPNGRGGQGERIDRPRHARARGGLGSAGLRLRLGSTPPVLHSPGGQKGLPEVVLLARRGAVPRDDKRTSIRPARIAPSVKHR